MIHETKICTQESKRRRLALQALYQWQIAQGAIGEIERQYLENNNGKKIDLEYFSEILRGVTAQVGDLDAQFAEVLDRPLEQLNPIELTILRIAVFELTKRLDVPYKVVINEGVELAKTFGAQDGHKYVNGILDKVAPKLRQVEYKAKSK